MTRRPTSLSAAETKVLRALQEHPGATERALQLETGLERVELQSWLAILGGDRLVVCDVDFNRSHIRRYELTNLGRRRMYWGEQLALDEAVAHA